MMNKDYFLKKSEKALDELFTFINDKPSISILGLEAKSTIFIIIDMIEGFAREGALKSERVEQIIPEIVRLALNCQKQGIKQLLLADSHTGDSPEFAAYPCHCLKGTSETEVVKELKALGGYERIEKNSTNGFLEPQFQNWLRENPEITNFIIAGDCTDICILQFATTLKAYFNRQNQPCRVIVPVNAVDTYDLGMHNADLMHYMSLYLMAMNNIEIIKGLEI